MVGGSKSRQKSHRQPLLPLLGVTQNPKLQNLAYAKDLDHTHAGSLSVGSVSVSPLRAVVH